MKQKYITIPSTAQALVYLLVIAVFILGKGVLKNNYIIAGILLSTVGFYLSWFMKDKKSKIKQILINTGYVSVLFLGTYKILKSSFLVEDIFFIVLEIVLIVQIIVSFDSYSPKNLRCIQVLSLVTFMCLSLFADTTSLMYPIISILYLFIWAIIIKIQMLSRDGTLPISTWPSYLVYLLSLSLILAVTNILGKNIAFNIEPKKGHVLETKKFNTKDKLFDLQATLFEITVTAADESPKDRKEIMQNVTYLFQESPIISKFERANATMTHFLHSYGPDIIPETYGILNNDDLIDPIKKPGSSGFIGDSRNRSIAVLKNFIDSKTDFKNTTLSANILDKIISKDKTLTTKIKISLSLDNIRRATTQKTMAHRINLLNKTIKTLHLDNQTKEQLNKIVSDLKEWKLYSLYNNLRNSLKNNLINTKGNEILKNKISDFIKQIEEASTVSEMSELHKEMESIKSTLQKAHPGQKDDFKESLETLLEAKMELNLAGDADLLGKRLTGDSVSQNPGKSLDSINTFKKILEAYKNMLSAQEIGEFLEKLKSFEQQSKTNVEVLNLLKSEDWQELINSKIEMFYNKEKGKIKKVLKEGLLSEADVKRFMESIDDFSSQKQQNRLQKKEEISEKIQDLSEQGLIPKDTAEELSNQLNNLSKITEAKDIVRNLGGKKVRPSSGNYHQELKEFAELNIAGNNELKKEFDDSLNKMITSHSVQGTALLMTELEDILNKIKLENVTAATIKEIKNKINELKEMKDNPSLIESIESLIEDLKSLKDMAKESKEKDNLEEIIDSLEENSLKGEKPDESLTELEGILNKIKLENIPSSEIQKMENNLNKLKEIKDKSFLSENITSLIKDLDTLKDMTEKSENKSDIEKIMDSLEESSLKGEKPDESLTKKLENILNEAKLTKVSPSSKKVARDRVPVPPSWQIDVFPKRLVLTQGEKNNVKAIGFYNNSIIKDLTDEVNWTFENPSIARIDEKGAINIISTGKTKAIAFYGDNKSNSVEIIVLEPLDYETQSLKEYLQ